MSKSFAGVRVLKDVDFVVRPGEVHALLGENGAGKSTLIKIIAGVHAPDSGVIRIGDRELAAITPREAAESGVATVYQELLLFPELTVAENVFLGHAPKTGLGRPEPVDVHSVTGWRRGRLIFDGRPLGSVVAEMDRYRRGKIVITDHALEDLPVTGSFDTSDTDALLDAVAEALPVQVRRLPLLVLIERDPNRPLTPFQRQR